MQMEGTSRARRSYRAPSCSRVSTHVQHDFGQINSFIWISEIVAIEYLGCWNVLEISAP